MLGIDTLVEATLELVQVDGVNKVVRLAFTLPNREDGQVEIAAHGVEELFISEMRLSNVVDHVCFIEREAELSPEIAATLFQIMRGRPHVANELEWPPLQEVLGRIRAGELSLLEIEPAYGASVLVLAKEFAFKPVRDSRADGSA